MMRNVCVNITNEDEDIVNDLVQMAFIRAYYSLLTSSLKKHIFYN